MIRTACLLCLLAQPLAAQVPQVLTDIPPIHSLVAMVMGDLGAPDLLLPPGISPHDFSFRPSEADMLATASVIIWVGPGLTPWLLDPVQTLGADAQVLTLSETPDWTALPLRTDPAFADDDHDEDHSDDAGHAHENDDPHAWLDPTIAAVWLDQIANGLSQSDPENATTYRANAIAAQADLETETAELAALLAPVRGGGFVTPHDAYQYFETAFDMPAFGAIALSDATRPGPARIADIKSRIANGGVGCVLTDSQTNPDWITLVTEGTQTRTAQIDDIGAGLAPGAQLYPDMLRRITTALAGCLGA